MHDKPLAVVGGVGLILTQWATSLGARVISTASSQEKAELSRKAGAVDVLSYPADAGEFGAKIRALTDGKGVAAVCDGVGKSTFDASLASVAIRGTLALFGAASGPVPPFDPRRLNAAGSVYLTRPSRPHFMRTREEFTWRTGELFKAIAAGTLDVTVGQHYPLEQAAAAHRDLKNRTTIGSVISGRSGCCARAHCARSAPPPDRAGPSPSIIAGLDDPIVAVANATIMSRFLPHATVHLHPGVMST